VIEKEAGSMSEPQIFHVEDRALFLRLKENGLAPSVVYDIGAAAGGWSAMMAAIQPKAEYHLFEPLPEYDIYKNSLGYYMGLNPTWCLHPIALSASNGEVTMSVGKGDNIWGSTILETQGDEIFERRKVSQWRLDDYVAKHKLPMPDFVKIDTQASERLIMLGGYNTISQANAMMVETWLYRGYGSSTPLLGDIIEVAETMGFVVLGFGGHYRDPQGVMQSVDAYFVKRDVAAVLNTNPN
jgi:FkbM family methyltransferase